MKTPKAFASSSIAGLFLALLVLASLACREPDRKGSPEEQASPEGDASDTASNGSSEAGSGRSFGSEATPIPAVHTNGSYPCPPGQVVFEAPRDRLCAKPCSTGDNCDPGETCASNAIAVERGGRVTNFVGYCVPSPPNAEEHDAGARTE